MMYSNVYKCGETVSHATFSPYIEPISVFKPRYANKQTPISLTA